MKPASLKTYGLEAVGLCMWLGVLARVFTHFDPGSQALVGWTSDAAIPVLQSNDPVFDGFRLYYYGQDRLGAWPWLLAQAWRALTSFDWTPHRLFLWHATWACGAWFALRGLHRQVGWVLAACFAALVLLSPLCHAHLFDLGQPYGWQLTALFLAWWALTRFVEALARPAPGRVSWAWAGLATLLSAMACWTSPISGPLLLVCLGVQGSRVSALSPPGRARWRPWLSVLPLVVGIVFEGRARALFHRFARKQFGEAYRTNLRLDFEHLPENVRGLFATFFAEALAPLVVFGWILGLIALGFLLHHLRRRTLGAHSAPVELAALTLALAGAALGNMLLCLVVQHVRENGYSIRYLVPTFVLGVLAAASGALFLLGQVPVLRARMGVLCAVFAGSLVAGGHLLVKPRLENPHLATAQAVTDTLVARAAGTVLIGGYWDSYVLGALDPARRLPTVVLEGDTLRTPFWVSRVREAEEVLVSLGQSPRPETVPEPPPWLFQYGAPLQLAESRWLERVPFRIARYRGVRDDTRPVRLEPSRGFKPCETGASLTVHFDPPLQRGMLVMGAETPPEGIEVEAPGALEARLEGVAGVWWLRLTSGEQPLSQVSLRVRSGRVAERCVFRGAALVTGAPLASLPP
ncbi:hypothetical protein [Cystobacter ferrugineus]|uniref:Glycosyltransferase RgtA/B/C/D-like domain-containing protein n=1 Tax=Cystobacter ferrugineus TaxID=83449 RepID=A0A1L9B473_9BACT|nr:hypothetical protein [Cystobacter ferrugineus]OJH37010.1 hypothetical protein BON30_31490 [Cystobacter ferrugineus]